MMNNEIKAKIDRLEAQELRFALVLHALAYLYSKVGKRQNPARHRFDKMTDGSTLDGLVSDFIERNRPENLKQSTQAITDEVFDRANSDNQERVMYATGMHNTAVGIINLMTFIIKRRARISRTRAIFDGINERTRPIMQKKTKILFTIDDKMDPHWQFTQTYDKESEALADFEDFIKGYHSIYTRGYKHDQTVHELWSKNRDEYWFWINSKPYPRVHAKISTAKE